MWKMSNTPRSLQHYEDQINVSLEAVRSRIAEFTKPETIDFEVKASKKGTFESSGIGGVCYETHQIRLVFDPKNPNMKLHLGSALERLIAQLYHHALRWAGPGYGAKLGSALASQGLAVHFWEQLYGRQDDKFAVTYTDEELAPWRTKAYQNFEARDHGHARWFSGADGYPACIGQIVSYDMVSAFLRENPEQTAYGLAHAPYSEFHGSLLPTNK